jgi:GMC oxidoreductase
LLKAGVAYLRIRSQTVNSITIRSTTNGIIHRINSSASKVILSAGTLGTAKIALNSGLQLHHPLVGKGLIDNEVWASRVAQQRPEGAKSSTREPILLQTMVNIDGHRALLSVTYNSNFFLAGSSRMSIRQYWNQNGRKRLDPRDGAAKIQEEDFDTVAVLLEFHAELDDENEVLDVASAEPIIRIKRRAPHDDERFQITMQDLATKIRNSTLELNHQRAADILAPRPTLLGLGVFAHEVGTMRMDGPGRSDGVVDENLQVKGFSNLFVSDLSVFPVSTPANPTRTLAGIVLRLSRFLEPDEPEKLTTLLSQT